MTLTIRPASEIDLSAAIALLNSAGLPVQDLAAETLALVAETDGEPCGVIGLQSFGEVALLRSLVVSHDARGAGIGPALVKALETACLADGVRELWLLTIDVDRFFLKLGYVGRMRSDAPIAIRSTEEFSGLCPGDAVLMSKYIGDSPASATS